MSKKDTASKKINFDVYIDPGVDVKPRKNSSQVAGDMTIVLTQGNGKRLSLSENVIEKLNLTDTVQFKLGKYKMLIGEQLPGTTTTFNLKSSGNKGMVYNAALVDKIAENYELDFSDCTSKTFGGATFSKTDDNVPVASIQLMTKAK